MTEKRFKRVLTHCMLLLTVVMLGSCTSDKFEAKIALKGLGNQNVHVVYCGADGGVVDTWMMAQSDRLEIAGSCASPSLLVLYNGMNVPIMRLVVSGGDKVKVSGDLINLYDAKVEGSDALEKWYLFMSKHKTAYQMMNYQMLNPEIEKYVKANPKGLESTLMLLFDYFPNDVAKVDKLLESIDESAKPESLLESYEMIKGRQAKPSTQIGTLNLLEMSSDDFEMASFVGSKPSVLFFWDKDVEKLERSAVIDELKMLDSTRVHIVDVNIDGDSVLWHSLVAADGTSWKHYWVPGSMMNSEVIRLQITSTPTIIVTDSLGKQQYRGNDAIEARLAVERINGK